MNRFFGKHLFTLIFGVIGGIFFLLGLIFIGIGISTNRDVDRVEQLPVLDQSGLDEALVDAEVTLEGKISERNPLQSNPFVAYTRETYQGERCRTRTTGNDNVRECEEVWIEDERVTPPLWIDIAGGRVQLANTDYQLQNPPFSQRSIPRLVASETSFYQGFRIGDPVFVLGRVVDDAQGRGVRAQLIYGGNRDAYLVNTRSSASTLTTMGGVFSGLGCLFLIILFVSAIFRR